MSGVVRGKIAARRDAERAARKQRDRLARIASRQRVHVAVTPDGRVVEQPVDPDRYDAAYRRLCAEPGGVDLATGSHDGCPLCRAAFEAAAGPPRTFR